MALVTEKKEGSGRKEEREGGRKVCAIPVFKKKKKGSEGVYMKT